MTIVPTDADIANLQKAAQFALTYPSLVQAVVDSKTTASAALIGINIVSGPDAAESPSNYSGLIIVLALTLTAGFMIGKYS